METEWPLTPARRSPDWSLQPHLVVGSVDRRISSIFRLFARATNYTLRSMVGTEEIQGTRRLGFFGVDYGFDKGRPLRFLKTTAELFRPPEHGVVR